MVTFYSRLKKNMPRLGLILYLTPLVFLIFQVISSSLSATLEEDEFELAELLKKRLAPFENPWDRGRNENQIQALYKRVREHYEPLVPQDPEAAITLGTYIALVEDGEEGVSYILPFANQGNARAQYLTGFFLCQLERKKEAMEAFAEAALHGHQKALEHLKIWAYQLKDPYALLELSHYFFFKNDRVAEGECLEQVIDDPILQLSKPLIQGYLRLLRDDFEGAMQLYRGVAVVDPERAKPYIDHLFQDPNALFQLLKVNVFQGRELEKGQSLLISSISESEEKRAELKSLANENLDATYIYGCVLLKDRTLNKNTKKLPLSWGTLDPLLRVAGANHKLAEQKLKEVMDRQKQPELWFKYGCFLLEKNDQKSGLDYIKKAARNNYTPATDHLLRRVMNGKSLPLPVPLKQTPKNFSPSTAPKVVPDWLKIGCTLEGRKQWQQAIDAFEKVNGSQRIEATYRLGQLYYGLFKKNKETKPEEALQQAKKAHEFFDRLGDQHPRALYTLGKLFYLEQEREKAEEKWEAALNLGYTAANYRLGILYAERKEDMEKSRGCFRQAGKQGVPKAYLHAAWVSSVMSDFKGEAEDLYWGARAGHVPCLGGLMSAAKKKSLPALFNLGSYYFAANQLVEARESWEQISLNPEGVEYAGLLAYNYAQLALREGKIEEAIKLLKDLAESGDGHAYAAYASLGKIFRKRKDDIDTALEFYQKALEICPNNGKILHDVALLDYFLGRIDIAASRAAEALLNGEQDAFSLLNKIYTETHNPLAALNLGSVALQAQKPLEARNYWKKALKSKDSTVKSAAHFNLCMMVFAEGNVVKVEKETKRGIEDGDKSFVDHLQTFAHLEASSSAEKEKKARAIKVLKKLAIPLKKPVNSEPLNNELS
jgi:Tfp pilus assembly protein PilF